MFIAGTLYSSAPKGSGDIVSGQFLNLESKWYFLMWVFIVALGWILWFFTLEHIAMAGDRAFVILVGLGVGIISGLSPVRAFQACFLGLLIIALFTAPFGIFLASLISASLTALFALACALGRNIILHQEIDIELKQWQWVLLIGGLTCYCDIDALGIVYGHHKYSYLEYVVLFYIPDLMGLFAAGFFTGIFSREEYGKLMRTIVKVLAVSHSIFVLYAILVIGAPGKMMWEGLLPILLMGLLFADVYVSTKIGNKYRKGRFIKSSTE